MKIKFMTPFTSVVFSLTLVSKQELGEGMRETFVQEEVSYAKTNPRGDWWYLYVRL